MLYLHVRQLKKTKEYAQEIHDILLEDHNTDIPIDQINHVLDITNRRIVESLENYRYVKVQPFFFYYRLGDLLRLIKRNKIRDAIRELRSEYPRKK